MQHDHKFYGSVVVLGFFSFCNFVSASGGSSVNYKIDNDTVSPTITQNSSSSNYSATQEGAGGDQITVSATTTSTTTTATTTTATTTQVAAASSISQATSGGSGLRLNLPPSIAGLPSIGILPVISRIFPSIFVPEQAPGLVTSTAEVTPTSTPARALFDIRAVSIKSVYLTNEQPEIRILFDNFGRRPTKVDFTILVENSSGNEILHYSDSITVETTGVYIKKMDQLPAGSYRVVVRTRYAENIANVFSANFTVSTSAAGAGSASRFISSLATSTPREGWVWAGVAVASVACAIILKRRGVV